MSLNALASLRRLGIEGNQLALGPRLDKVRGLFSLCHRKEGSMILRVPFRSVIAPFTQEVGPHKAACEAATRAGLEIFTPTPKNLTFSLPPHEASAAIVLALTQIENMSKMAAVNPKLSKEERAMKFVESLTPFQRWVTLLPLSEPVVEGAVKFNSEEDDYFFAYHNCIEAIAANLCDAVGQCNLSAVATDVYEKGEDEPITNITRWAVYAARSRALWLRTGGRAHPTIPVIAPGIDFVNHSTHEANAEVSPNCSLKFSDTSAFASCVE